MCIHQLLENSDETFDLEDIYIFVGAVGTTKLSYAFIGGYGHVEILQYIQMVI